MCGDIFILYDPSNAKVMYHEEAPATNIIWRDENGSESKRVAF